MTPFMALICLGLSVGTRTPVQAGTLPRPTLWAEPGSLVPWKSPVTLWCQGSLGTNKLYMYKTSWEKQLPLKPGDKAKFTVSYMTDTNTGTYYCSYLSPTGWSVYSDPLELVVTGLYHKPSLSVSPSPVVASRDTVTLQCGSDRGFNTFVLTQEGDPESPWKLGSQQIPSGQRQALFRVFPGSHRHRWSIRCYGHFSQTPQQWSDPSDPLQLLVSGTSTRPSLLSPQGPIVTPGQISTLQCRSKVTYDTFALYKEKSQDIRQHPGDHPQAGLSQANFTLGPVSDSHGGRHRCFGRRNFTSLWSEPSEPIDILVAEQLPYTPTLSVDTGSPVTPGDNVTLLCWSSGWMSTFLLVKEGTANPSLHDKLDKTEEITQAQFFFHPVTSAHNGTYRCYSSNSISPYRLSHPSVPLHLWVSGPSGDRKTAYLGPLFIGVSTAGALLGLFLLLFLLRFLRHCRRRQAGHHKSGATYSAPQDTGLHTRSRPSAHLQEDSPGDSYRETDGWGFRDPGPRGRVGLQPKHLRESPENVPAPHPKDTFTPTQPEEGVRLNPQSRQDEDPHGASYAQLKHAGLMRGVASCNPLSGAQLNAQDLKTEEDTLVGVQAETPESTLEVTYAQLNYLDTAQEITVSSPSLLGVAPEEPNVYAALAFH